MMISNRSYGIIKIADLPFYTEGPVTDNDGNIYFTTLTGGGIFKINDRNQISKWASSLCPNGQIILPDGDHLVCDSRMSAVRRFSREGNFLKNEIEGFCSDQEISTPNDLITDKNGNLYFTDSIRHTGKVFFLGGNGEQKVVVTGIDYPNGLVLSADENWLIIAESYTNRILKVKLMAPGLADGATEDFVELPKNPSGSKADNLPDGLALGMNGELLVAHYGMQAIQVISEEGNLLLSIDSGMPLTSNLCFIDEQSIIVTGGFGEPGPGGIFRISL